jgi:hypothetical protein
VTDKPIRWPHHPSPAPESPANDSTKEAMISAANVAKIDERKARFSG